MIYQKPTAGRWQDMLWGSHQDMMHEGTQVRALDQLVVSAGLFSRAEGRPYYGFADVYVGVDGISTGPLGDRKLWRRHVQVTVSPSGRKVYVYVDGILIPEREK